MNENLGEQTKKDAKAETKEEEPHMEKVERPDAEKILNSRSGIHFAQDIKKPTDMFKDGKKVASIGDVNYKDFSVTGDKDRQRAYKARFAKTRNKVGTPSYYADRVLWS